MTSWRSHLSRMLWRRDTQSYRSCDDVRTLKVINGNDVRTPKFIKLWCQDTQKIIGSVMTSRHPKLWKLWWRQDTQNYYSCDDVNIFIVYKSNSLSANKLIKLNQIFLPSSNSTILSQISPKIISIIRDCDKAIRDPKFYSEITFFE